jgi:hypothetical protein
VGEACGEAQPHRIGTKTDNGDRARGLSDDTGRIAADRNDCIGMTAEQLLRQAFDRRRVAYAPIQNQIAALAEAELRKLRQRQPMGKFQCRLSRLQLAEAVDLLTRRRHTNRRRECRQKDQ